MRGSHDAIVRALVAAGVDASGPLYDACASGDTPIVNVLLSAPGVNPNTAREVCVSVYAASSRERSSRSLAVIAQHSDALWVVGAVAVVVCVYVMWCASWVVCFGGSGRVYAAAGRCGGQPRLHCEGAVGGSRECERSNQGP